jgi:hypothetical protein
MTCNDIDYYLDAQFGRAPAEFSEEARAHLETCRRCRELLNWIRAAPRPVEVPTELRDRIGTELSKSLEPVTPLPSRPVLAAIFLASFAVLALAFTGMMGWAGLQRMNTGQLVSMTAIFAGAAVCLACSLGAQMAPGSRTRAPAQFLIPVFIAGFLAGAGLLFPWSHTGRFMEQGIRCSTAGILMVVPAALLFTWLARRGAVLSLPRLGATVGVTAGMLAVTVLQFRCALQEASHLAVWHGAVPVVSTVAGLVIGKGAERFGSRTG